MNIIFTQEQKDRLIRDRDDTKRSLEALVIQLAAAQSEKEILEAFGSLKFQGDQAQMLLNEYQVLSIWQIIILNKTKNLENNMDFKKLPSKIRKELIDLSGLSDEEIIEKMQEVFSENSGEPMTLDPDESLQGFKKKVPAYVEQFGVNKRKNK